MKRIAVSRLRLPNGEIRRNQVIELNEKNNQVEKYYPLTEELPNTEWHDITFHLSK
ncbi:MAG: hypothetical protein J6R79_05265 [Bacteroidaceae bacterium]|nr:hypothetical protein [Bacteroidaceae bacterium]